ncbi:MAG: RNA-splicing ligase RtcB [Planctomyces sp.]|nr:RNA-splicing ligase RtcB [Planctomyces sp.]
MNKRQLMKIGVPERNVKTAIALVQEIVRADKARGKEVKQKLAEVVEDPDAFLSDEHYAPLAKEIVDFRDHAPLQKEPIPYKTWGDKVEIDDQAHHQMREACELPMAFGAALMPDAHVGYGLPIGGVLACENAVIPYAVGVDIACRMKLSVFDMPVEMLDKGRPALKDALEKGTRFGVGSAYEKKQQHDVMDQDWTITRITREKKDTAWKQLGTSGSGNHFVEFGVLTIEERDDDLGLHAGKYLALLSHSGSRGAGAAVCDTYSAIARSHLPPAYEKFGRLAWLDLDSEAGQEYWAAMNLMGDYAAANHAVIHRQVAKFLGAEAIASVENHHNFAWIEEHDGKEVVVHRKGATPAGPGVLGVIPGSMADPAFVVRGKGNPASLHSASHGAGRRMSRKKAKDIFNFKSVRNTLRDRGIDVLSAGADEVPGVYKDIREVMAEQEDLVEAIARFDPKIVKMSGDGSRPED